VPFIPGPPQLPIESCYDPTPEYGLLAIEEGIEAGVIGAGTETGCLAFESMLARIAQIGNINLGGCSFYRFPDMRHTEITWGGLIGPNCDDPVLNCDNMPYYPGEGIGGLYLDNGGWTSVGGTVTKLFTGSGGDCLFEGGFTYSLTGNSFSQAAVDAIVEAAASLIDPFNPVACTLALDNSPMPSYLEPDSAYTTLFNAGWTMTFGS
jgi:hypothetical protein